MFNLFGNWGKWKIYKSDVPHILTKYNSPLLGGDKINVDRVMVDIYVRENKKTGLKKYKRVIKYQ